LTLSAKRKRLHAVDRRKLVLEAALSVFAKKGYAGATTREIAAAAGVTEAIIFRHFPNKQDLFRAVLDLRCGARLQTWLDVLRGQMGRNDDVAVLRTVATGALQCYRDNLDYERLLLFAALEGHEVGLAHNREFTIPIMAELTEYLIRRQREGAMRECCPELILVALAGAAHYYGVQTGMFGLSAGDHTDQEVVETMIHIILNGLRPRTGNKADCS
jgi:TetR/AcrR family transcriptional regulator